MVREPTKTPLIEFSRPTFFLREFGVLAPLAVSRIWYLVFGLHGFRGEVNQGYELVGNEPDHENFEPPPDTPQSDTRYRIPDTRYLTPSDCGAIRSPVTYVSSPSYLFGLP